MDKNRNVENGIRGQVMDLNPPVMQKAMKEIRGRNRESARNERKESNNFLGFLLGKNFSYGPPPLHLIMRLQQPIFYTAMKMEISALTWFPCLCSTDSIGSACVSFDLLAAFFGDILGELLMKGESDLSLALEINELRKREWRRL